MKFDGAAVSYSLSLALNTGGIIDYYGQSRRLRAAVLYNT